jgi:hypothetical protein
MQLTEFSATLLDYYTPDDRNLVGTDGYTMLEEYLNSLTMTPTSVTESHPQLPEPFLVAQNYPNPFNPETTILYSIPSGGRVSIRIYHTYGRLVKELLNRDQAPGQHTVRWDGTDSHSVRVSSGVYFAAARFGARLRTIKLQLLK